MATYHGVGLQAAVLLAIEVGVPLELVGLPMVDALNVQSRIDADALTSAGVDHELEKFAHGTTADLDDPLVAKVVLVDPAGR